MTALEIDRHGDGNHMILTCSRCGKRLNVPDASVGERGKCPACGAIVSIPEAENAAGTSAPAPSADATNVTATPPAHAPSTEHVTEQPAPFEVSPRRRDDDYDDDAADDAFDDLARHRIRLGADQPNSLAITAMVLGIVSLTIAVPGMCCCTIIAEPLAAVAAIAAIICGVYGTTPGSEGYARTGIICGSIALVCVLLGIIFMIAMFAFQIRLNQAGFG
jgi:hypothetical protein